MITLSKDLYKKIEELEVKDDFEKINSGIDYSKYTLKEKKNFNFRLVLVPLTILVILAVILPLTGIFNTPSDESDLPDDSVLGEEMLKEEYEKINTIILDHAGSSDIRSPIGVLDLIRYYSKDNPLVEFVVRGYGNYICGYLNKETVKKIEDYDKNKIYPLLDFTFMKGIDSVLYYYQTIKICDILTKESILDGEEFYFYYHQENKIVYETENKRLVAVWKELLLEDKEGREFKILLNVKGSIKENFYIISEVLDYNSGDNRKIFTAGDKFVTTEIWAQESFVPFQVYDCMFLRVETLDGIEYFYQDYYVFKDQDFTEDAYPYLVENIEINNLLESVILRKEYFKDFNKYINHVKYEAESWGYWIDYSKFKEIYNFK